MRLRPWWPDSRNTASGEAGAVHYQAERSTNPPVPNQTVERKQPILYSSHPHDEMRMRLRRKGDTMSKRVLLIGLLVVGVALLSGCALVDQFIDSITGGGTGGGTIMPEYPISGRMKFNLAATVWKYNMYPKPSEDPISSYAGNVAATFWSGAGRTDEDSLHFNADNWDGGDFSGTGFMAGLSEDGKTIVRFFANQTQANIWGGYTYEHHIDGVNVPYSHKEGNSRYYRVEGTAARALVTGLEFSMWVPGTARGSIVDPLEWIEGGPAALTGGAGDYIEIRLDYQNTATSPFD
jgi:hypothetical protein